MYFFILVYIILVLIRPQDYPEWAGSGIPFQPIALVLAFLCWLPARDKDLSAPQNLLLPAFLLAQMASHLVNGWAGGALEELTTFGPAVLAFFVLSHVAAGRERLLMLLAVFALCGLVLAAHGIEQAELGEGWTGIGLSQGTRIQYVGIFNDPNDLGMLFLIVLPMALFLSSRGGWAGLRRLFWWGAAAAIVYAVYLTASRGAAVALLVVTGVWVWRRRGIVWAGVIGVAALAALVALPSRLGELDAGESSAAGRVDAWYTGLEMFLSHPLFGIGPGLFADNNANLTAHNSFVLVIAEMGIVGYVIWLAFLGYGLMMSLAVLRHSPQPSDDARVTAEWKSERALAMTMLLSQVGYLATAFFLSRSYVILLYLLAAVVVGWYTGMRRRWPGLPTFSLARDLVRWPALAVASIVGLYIIVKLLLATS
ncbi:O-antigen ligase family protein [Dokdonella sp.]|uniref:O-antigen ligase family protein n=1 Tax=Dokdonella sp. TaxID=2291710 RepID=UPI0025C07C35|nr:O-antigen ligase family protein [Dokdonella sp.]MBX3691666.1 O-antigen ligase family protein [Dokdonella sp.]MCW5567399.1 O-antigen ligase family protein [Dokdonella sp.]